MNETVLLSRNGPVATLTLNCPDRHNSLGQSELGVIQQSLDKLESEPGCRVLVITGSGGKTFCAGANLEEMQSGQMNGDLFQDTTDRIAASGFASIAAINGSVYGGGTELALACDYRIGRSGTRMKVPAAAIGLCYPVSGIQRFVSRLGSSAAKRILMAAEEFDSNGMLDIGFLDQLVEPAKFDEAVSELCERLAALAPLSVSAMKGIIDDCALGVLNRDYAEEKARKCLGSEDLQEGFAARREKRKPEFKGR